MIGVKELKKIREMFLGDETLCRLLVHMDKDPLSEDRDDVVGNSKYDRKLSKIFKFQPQFMDLESEELCRVAIYKGKLDGVSQNGILTKETISVDIMIPTRLNDLDLRVYQIENRILELLDEKQINQFEKVVCTASLFSYAPSISGYCVYRMSFDKMEIRRVRAYR